MPPMGLHFALDAADNMVVYLYGVLGSKAFIAGVEKGKGKERIRIPHKAEEDKCRIITDFLLLKEFGYFIIQTRCVDFIIFYLLE